MTKACKSEMEVNMLKVWRNLFRIYQVCLLIRTLYGRVIIYLAHRAGMRLVYIIQEVASKSQNVSNNIYSTEFNVDIDSLNWHYCTIIEWLDTSWGIQQCKKDDSGRAALLTTVLSSASLSVFGIWIS